MSALGTPISQAMSMHAWLNANEDIFGLDVFHYSMTILIIIYKVKFTNIFIIIYF